MEQNLFLLKHKMRLTTKSKTKLELESDLSEILLENCKFIRDSTPVLSDKTQT